MGYRAIVRFKDLQDVGYIYNAGDVFPHAGLDVTDDRLKELSTNANRQGYPLIKRDTEEKKSRRRQKKRAESDT